MRQGGTSDDFYSPYVEEVTDVFGFSDPEPLQFDQPCSSPEEMELIIQWGNIMLSEDPPHMENWVASCDLLPLPVEGEASLARKAAYLRVEGDGLLCSSQRR